MLNDSSIGDTENKNYKNMAGNKRLKGSAQIYINDIQVIDVVY